MHQNPTCIAARASYRTWLHCSTSCRERQRPGRGSIATGETCFAVLSDRSRKLRRRRALRRSTAMAEARRLVEACPAGSTGEEWKAPAALAPEQLEPGIVPRRRAER